MYGVTLSKQIPLYSTQSPCVQNDPVMTWQENDVPFPAPLTAQSPRSLHRPWPQAALGFHSVSLSSWLIRNGQGTTSSQSPAVLSTAIVLQALNKSMARLQHSTFWSYPLEIGRVVHKCMYQNVQGLGSKKLSELSVDSCAAVSNNTAGSRTLPPTDPNGNPSQICSTM